MGERSVRVAYASRGLTISFEVDVDGALELSGAFVRDSLVHANVRCHQFLAFLVNERRLESSIVPFAILLVHGAGVAERAAVGRSERLAFDRRRRAEVFLAQATGVTVVELQFEIVRHAHVQFGSATTEANIECTSSFRTSVARSDDDGALVAAVVLARGHAALRVDVGRDRLLSVRALGVTCEQVIVVAEVHFVSEVFVVGGVDDASNGRLMLFEERVEGVLKFHLVELRARRHADLTDRSGVELRRQLRADGDVVTDVQRLGGVQGGVQRTFGVEVEADRSDFLERDRTHEKRAKRDESVPTGEANLNPILASTVSWSSLLNMGRL